MHAYLHNKVNTPRFTAVVVLYNQHIRASQSLQHLQLLADSIQVVVCDNSTIAGLDNLQEAKELHFDYIDMRGNRGLPKAYNAAVAYARGRYITIFDDDSMIDDKYFEHMSEFMLLHSDVSIALPVVLVDGRLFSPVAVHSYRYRSIKDLNHVPKRISGINSGMCISRELFDSIRYNEELFLDCVDHDFVHRALSEGAIVSVCKEAVLHQNYSRKSDDSSTSFRRLQLFKADYRVFCSNTVSHKLFCEAALIWLRLKSAIKYKEARFLRI